MRVWIVLAVLLQGMLFANADALYKPCAGCHGLEGEKVANGVSKIINQMSKEDFISAMEGYKDGSYGGNLKALMRGQVMRLSKEDIEALATKIVK
ncbi:c-type cytochrome [Sulfurospirillum sp. T05]|uniref:C-type cytochrome n=1 Tax=Sulfurospirillum tamanense TaxID=2813362 RepID=A0ABS2WPF5_9BACT|nr:c-type cytochrome [Sulfurospirillum tamanensis]MBN2963554.1 c-type cytochrome [Sulfurospirillum tamanensis]